MAFFSVLSVTELQCPYLRDAYYLRRKHALIVTSPTQNHKPKTKKKF